jgi:hypothetical protein
MQPEPAKFLLNLILPQLKSEQPSTKRVLCGIPPDCGEYRPNAKCMTAIQLAWHLSVVEIWFLDAVIQRQFGTTAPRPAKLKTAYEVPQWHEDNLAQRVPPLEALSGDALITPLDFIGLRNDPAVAYLNRHPPFRSSLWTAFNLSPGDGSKSSRDRGERRRALHLERRQCGERDAKAPRVLM